MDGRGVDRDGLLGRNVRTILEVTVLPLLLGLEVETSETTQVLSDDSLVDGGASPDSLSLIVSLCASSRLCMQRLTL